MTSSEIRQKFLQFFADRGHAVIPSASLIPENDPSVLFTTAGMQPLIPYFKGEKHPLGKRITDIQKCLRTVDIDNVGDDTHNTFFEMVGYWSLGDYFKKESIEYTYGFYEEVLGFNKDDISVTVFEGDDVAPFDSESYYAWKDIVGIPENRIYKYGKGENWWGLSSGIGPCGPCSEMFIDTGKPKCSPDCGPACDCGKFVEIGNNVFIEYEGDEKGSITKLQQHNVDVGLGLERLVMLNQGKTNIYDTDLFEPIIAKITELYCAGATFCAADAIPNNRSARIIADHIRAATFAISDGAIPSNTEAGYIVRRLIRRAIRHGHLIGIEGAFVSVIAEAVVKKMGDVYPELVEKKDIIFEELDKEEEKFLKTLQEGLKAAQELFSKKTPIAEEKYLQFMGMKEHIDILKHLWERKESGKDYSIPEAGITESEVDDATISGKEGFLLFQSYGFPSEMIIELATEKRLFFYRGEFRRELAKHQELSRTANAGVFKGGLAESNEITTKYHTATHMLLAAIRQVLGSDIFQKGSNINSERLRFDFNYPDKIEADNLKQIEDIVNQKIGEALPVQMMEMPKEEALRHVAVSFDPSKYPDIVKVYKIGGGSPSGVLGTTSNGPFSVEVCGGPHVGNTSELGHFRILKEESSSSGIRRIKAVLE